MALLDPSRFPAAAAYLRSVPGGLGAHPECQAVGDMLRVTLDEFPGLLEDPGVSAPVRQAIETVRSSDWVPDVLNVTVRLMARDREFATDAEYLAWNKERSLRVFETPLYRVLMFVMSPTLVLMGATRRWGKFRRGTTLRGKGTGKGARLQLEFPDRLYNELMLRTYAASFDAALVAAGATGPDVELVEQTPTRAAWAAVWK